MDAIFYKNGDVMDMTAAAAITGGDLVSLPDGRVGLANRDAASGEVISVVTSGIVKVAKVEGAIAAGMPVGFDDNGNPYGGTAGAGGATILLADANRVLGCAIAAAASAATHVYVDLNKFSPKFPYWANRTYATVTTSTVALAQSGYVLQCATDNQTLTLAAIADASGVRDVILQNCNADGKALTVDGASSEKLVGNGVAITTGTLTNTAATAKQGDYIWIGQAIPAVAQFITDLKGVWAAT